MRTESRRDWPATAGMQGVTGLRQCNNERADDAHKKTRQANLPGFYKVRVRVLQRDHVLRLRAFLAFTYGELHFLAFLQCFEPIALDRTEVYEHITLTFTLDEAETFFVIEPFYGSNNYV